MPPDPFDLLGLEPRFDLDPVLLRRAYLERARVAHPDRLTAHDVEAEARAADLNRAQRTLADPEARAGALLARLGGPSKERDRSLPEGFLGQMLGVREQVEEARGAGNHHALQGWVAWTQERRRAHIDEAARLFGALGRPPAPADLARIRRELNAWRYIERLNEQLEATDPPAESDRGG